MMHLNLIPPLLASSLTTDIIGYIASAIILISFLMKNMKKLRIVNTLGCGVFMIYGMLLDMSIPLIITNGAIIFINLYYLFSKK
jgi:hypothetical protein